MANLNKVILIGNLTRDPEVRFTPSGKAVADVGLAVNRRYRTSDGNQKEEVCYVSVVVWGKQAENCGEYLRKGSSVFVDGRLQYDEWEKDGKKQSRLRVVANTVQFLSGKGQGGGRGAASKGGEDRGGSSDADVPPADTDLADDDNLPF